ncbi:hypothetical protein [Plantactinospora sp. B5E13]|uniref:hypothetical protein n=1 Tax=unclassified Plantactinospora TaxID=2631981 RepID=UPI00325F89B3
MSEGRVRYYLDWGIAPGEEVAESEAVAEGDYSRGHFDELGQPDFVELFEDGGVFHVDYWSTDLAAVRDRHLRQHPGIPFGVQMPVEREGGYRWDVSLRHDRQGEQVGRIFILHDEAGRPVLDVAVDAQNRLRKLEKQQHHSTGKVRYVFRYDVDGKIVDIYDNVKGDNLRVDEVLRFIDDPDFYRDGFSLPAGVSGRVLSPFSSGQAS